MTDPITTIAGIGPATAEGFARAGIRDAQTLRAMGAHEGYRAWLRAGNPAHFIGYYALVMTLQGRPWNDCRGAEKAALRAAFDALKSEVTAEAAGCAPQGGRPSAARGGRAVAGDGAPAPLPPGAAHDLGRLRLEAALDEIGLGVRR